MRRKNPDERSFEIAQVGLKIALKVGIYEVTIQEIANRIGISRSLIFYYYTLESLRRAILELAQEKGLLENIAKAAIRTSRRRILLK